MKYKITYNELLSINFGIAYVDGIKEYQEKFNTNTTFQNSNAFFEQVWYPKKDLEIPEKTTYHLTMMLVFKNNEKITNGIISHEISHAVTFLINLFTNKNKEITSGSFSDEMVAYITEYFTNLTYQFFKENKITIELQY